MAISGAVVFASGSSGPVMMVMVIIFALLLWPHRAKLHLIRWFGVAALFFLDLIMKDPVYFLLAKIDITGGSTGWHRAALIQASLKHLNEWWLVGTDVTRHWMPTGVYASQAHTDITNYYLQMGVWGGLPLVALFVSTLLVAFGLVGRALRSHGSLPAHDPFLFYLLGCVLFGHAANFFSVVYFDQSVVFLYLILAGIGCLPAFMIRATKPMQVVGDVRAEQTPSVP
jgi:hypothetical protein